MFRGRLYGMDNKGETRLISDGYIVVLVCDSTNTRILTISKYKNGGTVLIMTRHTVEQSISAIMDPHPNGRTVRT